MSKQFSSISSCNFIFVEVLFYYICKFKCDKIVVPVAGAEDSETPNGSDVTLSSEGTELSSG